ncbi:MAG TPA: cytochrome c oxidase subunit 3 [Gammaproteobacteria bacterium]|nr:cytochrome c oxidase subunit 3 [Gammaproteobacteria bacterium]
MSGTHTGTGYYLPDPSRWPITGSIGLFSLLGGFALTLDGHTAGKAIMLFGVLVMLGMLFGWFGTVIRESEGGQYNGQVDVSFRWGMAWFIFSEVMFFAAFFGALFYARQLSVPWLGGEGDKVATHQYLWSSFTAAWPLLSTPNTSLFMQIKEVIPAFGVPAINTLLLLSSGVTVTIAHHALKHNKRGVLILFLLLTIALGVAFLLCQAHEYGEAYREKGLTLNSGIYGSTFFMLTGFHGLHVTLGAIMLTVIWIRCLKGHFKPNHHFGFEAVAWYWHFVDVVWLGLFIFVYWL